MMLDDALRLLGYAFRGGQEDTLAKLRDLNGKIEPIRRVGGDVDERLHQAALLAAVDVPDELVMWLVNVCATRRVTNIDITQLQRFGVDVQLSR